MRFAAANRITPRFALWLLLVLVLLITQLQLLQNVEPEAEGAAFAVASRRMLERANQYKEYWLLNGYPQLTELDGRPVVFSDSGWALPVNRGQAGCAEWFALLYPQQLIFNQHYQRVLAVDLSIGYQCRYFFGQDRYIELQLDQSRFSVSSGLTAGPLPSNGL